MDANRRVQQQLQRERDDARRRADKGEKQVRRRRRAAALPALLPAAAAGGGGLRSPVPGARAARPSAPRRPHAPRPELLSCPPQALLLLEEQAALKRKLNAALGAQDAEVRRLKAQNAALEGLCRTLQARSKGGGEPGGEGGGDVDEPPPGVQEDSSADSVGWVTVDTGAEVVAADGEGEEAGEAAAAAAAS